jgi:golgi phosphoprotein 3
MLSFAEEIYLLALDDVTGKITSYSEEISLSYALIGAVLCELSLINKIDTDPDKLYVVNDKPTGNIILDEVLAILCENESNNMPVSYWLKILLSNAAETEELVLSQLIEKGILKRVDERIFWVFHTRRYPIIDNKEIKTVEERLREIVLGNEIPDPRDAILISLVYACNLFEDILSPKERKRSEKRIQSLAKLDLVGREVVDMIKEIKNFNPSVYSNTTPVF